MNEPHLSLENENSHIERELFLRGIHMKYGYDFLHYAENTMRRRIDAIVRDFHVRNPIELLNLVLQNRKTFDDVLPQLTIGVSEMFRDPAFFKSLREKVVPYLKTFPRVTIWCAGCSTGEEVFSLAILLKEEELLERTLIFATDINPQALRAAREGIYNADEMKLSTRNYVQAGGRAALNEYYSSDYGFVKMDKSLISNVVFSDHNLATDGVFTEAHLILCRNVLIYFDRELQERVLDLFLGSLHARGFLGLGSRENLRMTGVANEFDIVDQRWRLYQRLRRLHA